MAFFGGGGMEQVDTDSVGLCCFLFGSFFFGFFFQGWYPKPSVIVKDGILRI